MWWGGLNVAIGLQSSWRAAAIVDCAVSVFPKVKHRIIFSEVEVSSRRQAQNAAGNGRLCQCPWDHEKRAISLTAALQICAHVVRGMQQWKAQRRRMQRRQEQQQQQQQNHSSVRKFSRRLGSGSHIFRRVYPPPQFSRPLCCYGAHMELHT